MSDDQSRMIDLLHRLQAALDGYPTYMPGLVASAKDEIERLQAALEAISLYSCNETYAAEGMDCMRSIAQEALSHEQV